MSKSIFSTIFFVLLSVAGFAQPGIVPKPAHMNLNVEPGEIVLPEKILVADPAFRPAANFLKMYVQQYYGFNMEITSDPESYNIALLKDPAIMKDGAYKFSTIPGKVVIKSANPAGIFYGVQSLIQLLSKSDLPASGGRRYLLNPDVTLVLPLGTIDDEPRFAYRGMHLDVARHFFPVSFVKKYIDYLALHKMNYFHWHLTDDQGWRIEIRKYPLLTKVGGFRNGTIVGHHPGTSNDNTPYGGFYTQEEIKEVVRYAAERYITVVPEIEMPGHASAAIAAYPKLSCFPDEPTKMDGPVSNAGNQQPLKKVQETWGVFEDVFCPSDYTFNFLQDVLNEVITLFPSKYIHIGGDECPKDAWKKSAFCQQLIKQKGLKDEHGLQSYFINRMEKYLNSKGRNIIGWDEILEGGLAPNATVMSWRGEEGGIAAARQNHQVIMTPGGFMYFDHSQTKKDDSITIGGYTTVQKVYSYNPVPKELEAAKAKYILGAQANLWTEYITNPRKIEYQIFPRMSALSEVLWSPAESRNWPDFEGRMQAQFKRYKMWRAAYSTAINDPANNKEK